MSRLLTTVGLLIMTICAMAQNSVPTLHQGEKYDPATAHLIKTCPVCGKGYYPFDWRYLLCSKVADKQKKYGQQPQTAEPTKAADNVAAPVETKPVTVTATSVEANNAVAVAATPVEANNVVAVAATPVEANKAVAVTATSVEANPVAATSATPVEPEPAVTAASNATAAHDAAATSAAKADIAAQSAAGSLPLPVAGPQRQDAAAEKHNSRQPINPVGYDYRGDTIYLDGVRVHPNPEKRNGEAYRKYKEHEAHRQRNAVRNARNREKARRRFAKQEVRLRKYLRKAEKYRRKYYPVTAVGNH